MEKGACLVALRYDRICDGPGDLEVGVVPADGALCRGIVDCTDLILDVAIFEGAVAMGKASGNEELDAVGELERFPLSEGGRVGSAIDGDIPDASVNDGDEFSLAGRRLEVEAAHDAFA